MSHHTDLQGSDAIVEDALRVLEQVFLDQRQPRAAAQISERGEHREAARNLIVELIAATVRNDELRRAQRQLVGLLGAPATTVLVLAALRQVQLQATKPRAEVPPLPLGIATPVPTGEERPTLKPQPPHVAHDAWTEDTRPTTSLPPKPTIGDWSNQPTKPVNPRRKP